MLSFRSQSMRAKQNYDCMPDHVSWKNPLIGKTMSLAPNFAIFDLTYSYDVDVNDLAETSVSPATLSLVNSSRSKP